MNNIIAQYQNGNTFVSVFEDGTKIREYEGVAQIAHPESIDVKITDYCDMGCAYCHESSTRAGKHGDLQQLLQVIEALPAGVELAIGGGNPLSHPHLVDFLKELKTRGIIANITVNQGHLKSFFDLLVFLCEDRLVNGVGVSITSNNYKYLQKICSISRHVVYHVIAGVNRFDEMRNLIAVHDDAKLLVLGYKTFGFGLQYFCKEIEDEINVWRANIHRLFSKCTLSFDNLAIEQLQIKSLFTEDAWQQFYMGDDFCFTMYIDAVKREFAPTSRSANRTSFDSCSLLDYFCANKN